jgi:hypothetical protein
MTFKAGDWALYTGVVTNEIVVVDEVLDDDQYAVRFLNTSDVFTVHGGELTAG